MIDAKLWFNELNFMTESVLNATKTNRRKMYIIDVLFVWHINHFFTKYSNYDAE